MTYTQALNEILPYMHTISGDAFKGNTDKLVEASRAMDILTRCPDELGFVYQTHNYGEYVDTFPYDADTSTDIPLSEDEFNFLKKIFGECE